MQGLTLFPTKDPAHALGVFHSVVIQLFFDTPSARCVEELQRLYASPLVAPRFAQLAIVSAAVRRPPEPATASAAARLVAEIGPRVAASAFAIEPTGLLGAAARAVLHGIHAIAPPRFPEKICRSVAEATPWLVETAGEAVAGVQPRALGAAVELLRARR